MQIGLVGLQYSGKTTLFNTLAKKEFDEAAAMKEEATIEVVKVPDERLDKLTEMFNPKKKVSATIEVYDTPGLRMSDDGKVKITNTFLQNVKDNDSLFFVIRQFGNDSVPHPMNSINPIRDINFLESEFLLADLGFFEVRLEKLKKDVLKTKDEKIKREIPIVEKCIAHLEEEKPLRTLELDENEFKSLSGYQLLSSKPLAIAINCDENAIEEIDSIVEKIRNELTDKTVTIIPFYAKIEYELSTLEEEEMTEFMSDYGIKESAQSKILRTCYEVLGLHSFFTVGEDECRAWTIKKNYTAQDSAGVIHTDFYNKFIRAEVTHYEDYMEHKSFAKCKEAGAWRLEGKEYVVVDGDILNIRHS